MFRLRLLVLLPLLSFLWLAGGVFVAGLFYPGYSHVSQFMSELGATGTVHGSWVNLIVFAGAEVWILLFLVGATRTLAGNRPAIAGLLLVALYAGLLLTAASFPCDFGCRPEAPSRSHLIHASAGVLAYVAGLCGLSLISVGLRRGRHRLLPNGTGTVLQLAGVVLVVGMLLSEDMAGLFQRLLEALLYLWMIRIGVVLSRDRPGSLDTSAVVLR